MKETSMHKIVRNGRNGAENLSTYRALKRREKYDDIISNFQHLQFLECKMALNETIDLFVLCPAAYTWD